MRWIFRVGIFAGIEVFIHATFPLLIIWVVWTDLHSGGSLLKAMTSALYVLSIFLCVLLHEYGHALTARRFGIQTRDITLYPIGGIARLERIPADPKQEFLVAIAGPLVNVAIAVMMIIWSFITSQSLLFGKFNLHTGSFFEDLLAANISLVFFNMLPAFPMDGGRILRSLLAIKLGFLRATKIAAGIGQIMAVLFGAMGFFFNPFLLFIAMLVWSGARQEAAMVERYEARN